MTRSAPVDATTARALLRSGEWPDDPDVRQDLRRRVGRFHWLRIGVFVLGVAGYVLAIADAYLPDPSHSDRYGVISCAAAALVATLQLRLEPRLRAWLAATDDPGPSPVKESERWRHDWVVYLLGPVAIVGGEIAIALA